MDRLGFQRINKMLRQRYSDGSFTVYPKPDADDTPSRYVGIGQEKAPAVLLNHLDNACLLYHEGEEIELLMEGPKLKYLGSVGAEHTFEDVAFES
jgi:hypothetical protein